MKTAKAIRAEHVGEVTFHAELSPHQVAEIQAKLDAMVTAIRWHDAAKELPDSDQTVLIHVPISDDPVWMGYHDGTTWRVIDGEPIDASLIDHWAQLPDAPKP